MINGWYCRSIADGHNNPVAKSESSEEEDAMPVAEHLMDHRLRYKNLKKKFKFLVYENEFLAESLRNSQHSFLKVAKDRTFLLDRLLQYEKPDMSSSESNDDTDSSDDDVPMTKKKKIEPTQAPPQQLAPIFRQAVPVKRKKIIQKKPVAPQQQQITTVHPPSVTGGNRTNSAEVVVHENTVTATGGATATQNIMTTEEVERHLQSRQNLIELRAPPTVPTEMFEPSLDSESEQLIETNEDCLM